MKYPGAVTGFGLAFIGCLGWLDFRTATGLQFEFFYLFTCAIVGWCSGTPAALLCTVASGILLYLTEKGAGPGPGWAWICTSAIRLLAFGCIGWLAAEAARATRDLERTIAERTARLRKEMEEHKETAELLREAMELFKQVAENITEVFWVTDPLEEPSRIRQPGVRTSLG